MKYAVNGLYLGVNLPLNTVYEEFRCGQNPGTSSIGFLF